MAVLKTRNFFELVKTLCLSKKTNYIWDQEGVSTFSETALRAFENAEKIFYSVGCGQRFFISAQPNRFFADALLSVVCSGNIAIPVNPCLNHQQLTILENTFKADYFIKDKFPDFSKKKYRLPGEIKDRVGAICLLTSGSTGEPKAVYLNQQNIFSNAYSVINSMKLENPGKIGIILPLYHSFALITQLFTALLTGGQIYMVPNYKFPGELINFIISNKIKTLAGVPTNFKLLLMGNDLKFESVKHITVAGAALDPVFAGNIKKGFPRAKIWVGYGLTEAGPRVTAINDSEQPFKNGSVGRPIDQVKIKIKDDEVIVKSPSVMEMYLDDKKTTSQKIIDQWLYTGDLGKIDENGYLYINGRKDDIFNSGGEKISPLTIERVLNNHPLVHTSAIYGETDSILGNKIIALVQPETNFAITAKELFNHCRKYLENHLIPHKFLKVKTLPLTSNGKLQRKELPQCQKEKL